MANNIDDWQDVDDWEDVPTLVENQEEVPASDPLSSMKASIGGTVGGAAGYKVGDKVADAANWATDGVMKSNVVGPIGKEIDTIAANPQLYSESNIHKSLNEAQQLAVDLQEEGIKRANAARESLRGKPNIPVETLYGSVARVAEREALDGRAGLSIPETREAELLQSRMSEIEPDLAHNNQSIQSIEDQMRAIEEGSTYKDQRLSVSEDYRNKLHENKLNQLSQPVQANPKQAILDEYNLQKENEKLLKLERSADAKSMRTPEQIEKAKADLEYNRQIEINRDNKLRDIDMSRDQTPDWEKIAVNEEYKDAKLDRKLQRTDEKIEKFQSTVDSDVEKVQEKIKAAEADFARKQEKTAAIRDIDKANAQAKLDSKKADMTFKKLATEEKAARIKSIDKQKELEKLLQQKKSLEEAKATKIQKAQTLAAADMDKVRGTPKEVLGQSDILKNYSMDEARVGMMNDMLENVRRSGATEISSLEADGLLRSIEQNVPADVKSGTPGKFIADVRREYNNDLGNMFGDYNRLKSESSQIRRPQDLLGQVGINYQDIGADKRQAVFNDGSRQALANVLTHPEDLGSTERFKALKTALEEAKQLGATNLDPESYLEEARLAAIKNKVDILKDNNKVSTFQVDSIAQGKPRISGILQKLGVSGQEFYAKNKGTIQKVSKGAGKLTGTVGGALMGGALAAQAAEDGRIRPEQTSAAALGEMFAPPLTSAVDAIAGGNEAYAEAMDQGDGAFTANAKGALGATGGFFKPANDLAKTVIPDLDRTIDYAGKATINGLNSMGQEQSLAAAARKEKNMSAIDKVLGKEKEEPKPHEKFKSFVEQSPAQLAELAELFKNKESGKAFLAPLEKAFNTQDERTRTSVLFGLFQQPAFRQMLKQIKDDAESLTIETPPLM